MVARSISPKTGGKIIPIPVLLADVVQVLSPSTGLPGDVRGERVVGLGKPRKNDQHAGRSQPGIAPTVDQVGGEEQAVTRVELVAGILHQVLDAARQAEDEFMSGMRHWQRTAVGGCLQAYYERLNPPGEFFPAQPLKCSEYDREAVASCQLAGGSLAGALRGSRRTP